MKRFSLVTLAMICVTFSFAQKGNNQFAVLGGYEVFKDMPNKSGYNVGAEFKHYVHNRIYAVANFHAGVNNGSETGYIPRTADSESVELTYKGMTRDYMIGFGLGGDIFRCGKHKIYAQGTVGLGSSEEKRDEITNLSPITVTAIERTKTSYALSVSGGYDYQINNWLAAGVNYTGYRVGYSYKNSCNAKLSFIF